MTSPLSYLYLDQDIFNFSNPNDLRHVFKEEGQPAADTSWTFTPSQPIPENIREARERSSSLTRSDTNFPLFPAQQNHPRRSSIPDHPSSSTGNPKEASDCESSLGEDNGMEFFFNEEAEETSLDTSSYDMETFGNEQDSSTEEQDMVPEETSVSPTASLNANFKLQSSKSPVIDALFYCALTKQGLALIDEGKESKHVKFRLDDFHFYYSKSKEICSKANPTDDVNSRVKALQRWFPDFPSLKEVQKGVPWVFGLSKEKHHVNFNKLQAILERQKALVHGSASDKSPSKAMRKNSRGT